MLQLGAGFNLELSGRRNVFLSGLAHGLRYAAIRELFDEIVEFSGIGRAIDRPLKSYSSGMLSRLAFSISRALRPDILLLDEVLAVGDAGFKEKSLGAMRELLARGGTVIVASHSLAMMADLCDRAVWLAGGEMREQGEAGAVVEKYQAAVAARR